MIERLQGEILTRGPEGVVLGVAGVGFSIDVSSVTLRDVPAQGERCELFTHLHVREDALQLFGFSTEGERELFRLLLSVSKIGPKLALAALSSRRAPDLRKALAAGDVALFASIPGIGRKTAERIILELREKMGDLGFVVDGESGEHESQEGDPLQLARSALVELGYSLLEADRLLASVDSDLSVEEMVRSALGKSS